MTDAARPALPRHVRIAIAGAGFAGLGAAIRLLQTGEPDLLVLEQADRIGGTWRDNTYPGCMCDVPSVLYSYSFAPNPEWSRPFSGQAEILAYLEGCVERFNLAPHLRLGVRVERAAWDDEAQLWRLSTNDGELTAEVFVAATGPLSEPRIPDLPGLESFSGEVFHSARWRHDLDLTGRQVAVIGTGASAIQFVPEIAPAVGRLTVFQRTAPWIIARPNGPVRQSTHRTYRRFPFVQRLARTAVYAALESLAFALLHPRIARRVQRAAELNLRRQVKDPQLRAALTPDYTLGCKRILYSGAYLPAIQRDNVRLVPAAVERVLPGAVVGADGVEHPADTIILGTGFHVTDQAVADRIVGRGGQTLAERWQGSPQAYDTVTVNGFPNLFLLLGPNSGLGHTSVVIMAEAGIAHLLAAMAHLRSTGAAALEPSAEAQAAFVREVDRRMRGSVWTAGGCQSWYLDRTGRNSALWPGFTLPFRRRLQVLRPADYVVTPRRVAA